MKFEDTSLVSFFFNANVGGPSVVFNSRSITFEKITISVSPFKPYYEKQLSLLVKKLPFYKEQQ
jgi:hypothetical protein